MALLKGDYMKTMICMILDRSGSMAGRQGDVIGGVNQFLEEQKKNTDPASIALVRFDTGYIERFRPMAALHSCQPLTAPDFMPRGGTPLLDAIGFTIDALDHDWLVEQPERCIVVIVTDGEENASQTYTRARIKQMITSRQNSGKWSFVYLGADVDSFHEAGTMGVWASNTANYVKSAAGMGAAYGTMSAHVHHTRTTGGTVAMNMGGDIGEDGIVKNKKTIDPAQGIANSNPPWVAPSETWAPPA